MPNSPSSPKPPGSGIDTGTGGFPVGQNGARQTYDVGSEVGDEYPKPAWSPGQINVDKQPRDLSKGTKATLASYLSATTLGNTPSSPTSVKNRYPVVNLEGENPTNFSLNDEKGYPAQPDRELDGYANKFTQGNSLEGRSKADTNLKIKRGRQGGNLPDGNDLLKDVTPVAPPASALGGKFSPPVSAVQLQDTSPVKQYYGNPDLSNSVIYNRFNPEGRDYQTQGAPLVSNQFAKKYNLGTSEAERDMSFGRLAQVGSILSSRASVELGSADPGYNPGQEMASAALPGLAQLGVSRIDRDELNAENVIEELTNDPVGSLINVAGQSWGTLNNVNDQFSNVSNFGMELLAVALLVALSVVILAMTALFSIGSSGATTRVKDDLGRRPYGSSSYTVSPSGLSAGKIIFGIWEALGITQTNNPLNVCIPTGALVFFGMNSSRVSPTGFAVEVATSGRRSVSQSPGYYSVLGRMIGRSFLQIGDSFEALGNAFNAGLFSGISQIFTVVNTIKISKFMKLLNLFATQGDMVLKQNEDSDNEGNTAGFSKRFTSDIDKSSNKSPLKGRMTNVDRQISPLTLSWASYRAPDTFIVPSGLQKVALSSASKKMGAHSIYSSLPFTEFMSSPVQGGPKNGSPYYLPTGDENRISTEDREKMEKLLDSEYVPFYMHDVRTNEIISFHAFLASLSDDYTANYDNQEGFGRVESIKIYKSTNRKIGFSFYVASTNSYDFDAMWQKINKLTTLLYPQFTEGRMISDSQNNIYMPFSQTIQAAPLARIRIGDLISSNYSKFNLARIFGYTYSGTQFNEKKQGKFEGNDGNVISKVANKLKELKRKPGSIFTSEKSLSVPDDNSSLETSLNGSATTDPNIKLPSGLVLEVVKYDENKQKIICKVALAKGEDSTETDDFFNLYLENEYNNPEKPTKKILNKNYLFDESDLIPASSTKEKLKDEFEQEYSAAVRDFMSDDPKEKSKGNAIARSFRSVGGKGLAGFIESMSFDWYDRVTWVTDEGPGRKAPRMCKVTISFAPIHDITPGLDHMGSNRAPIYNVKGKI